MDLKSLRCFVAVAEKLNFSRAAEELFISQPALSARISALEEEWGVPLFRRTRQKVFLTPAGSAVLPDVREILSRIDGLADAAKQADGREEAIAGKVVIGLDDTVPEMMIRDLTQALSELRITYPDIRIITEDTSFHSYENDLLGGRIDLCFLCLRESETVNAQFSTYVLSTEPMVLAYMGDKDVPLDELLTGRELLFPEGDERWNDLLLRYLEEKRVHARIRSIHGRAMIAMLFPEDTAVMMPISYYDSFDIPNLRSSLLDIPGSKTISALIWDKLNYNPALQLLINCFVTGTQNRQAELSTMMESETNAGLTGGRPGFAESRDIINDVEVSD